MNPGTPPGFKRLRLTVAYCGTPWRGWQSLGCGSGIQDEIQRAFLKAVNINVILHGSGRTDAGVHAFAQVAHCDVPEHLRLNDDAWVNSLNACLPLTIRIIECKQAAPDFHARFHAKGKVYRYRIWRTRQLSPLEWDRAWHIYGKLDMDVLRHCASMLVGTHNFARLSANRGDMLEIHRRALPEKTTRTIHRVEVRDLGDVVEIEFEGDGFLYKMVRLIVGSLVQVARGRATSEWFANLLATSEGLQSNQTAPSAGLYLVKVLY